MSVTETGERHSTEYTAYCPWGAMLYHLVQQNMLLPFQGKKKSIGTLTAYSSEKLPLSTKPYGITANAESNLHLHQVSRFHECSSFRITKLLVQ
jgi:hypothetical protein